MFGPNKFDLNNPVVQHIVRQMMPMGAVIHDQKIIVGVTNPDYMPNNEPRMVISSGDHPSQEERGNEVIMLTLAQIAVLKLALPEIERYLNENDYTLPVVEHPFKEAVAFRQASENVTGNVDPLGR